MKDVIHCDMLWLAVNRRYTHRFLNGATHLIVYCCPTALLLEDVSSQGADGGFISKQNQVFID